MVCSHCIASGRGLERPAREPSPRTERTLDIQFARDRARGSGVSRSSCRRSVVTFALAVTGVALAILTASCTDERPELQAIPTKGYDVVSAGMYHTCAIKNYQLRCWGRDESEVSRYYKEPDYPAGDFFAVSVGGLGDGAHACALRSPGKVYCWGANSYGQSDAPSGTYRMVSAGGFHSCALQDSGNVVCWGANFYGQTDPPQGRYLAVSAGGYHSCALHESKQITCWGSDSSGQLGTPAGRQPRLERYASLSAGESHTCAVRESGAVHCWGTEALPTDDADVPFVAFGQADPPAGKFRWVSAGATHTCGVRVSGELACWGSETTAPEGQYTWVSAGSGHTCAIRRTTQAVHTVACWGDDSYGQTGLRN